MTTALKTLSKTVWTKLTAAGESGTCWKKAGGQIVIDHTNLESAATLPLSNTNITVAKSKRVPLDKDGNDVLPISADDASDIFYGLALGDSDENTIIMDVI